MKKTVSFPVFILIAFLAVIPALFFTVSEIAPYSETEHSASVTSKSQIIVTESEIEKQEKHTDRKISDLDMLISCIVINDPGPFSNVNQADISQLMGIALWCALETDSNESYDFSQNQMLIDQKQVESVFYALFSSSVEPCHTTIESCGVKFTYDESKKAYRVPITGITPAYTGKEVKREQKGNILTVEVECIPENNWTQDSKGNIIPPEKEKSLLITVKENKDNSLSICSVACVK